jgi:hypothetical protein
VRPIAIALIAFAVALVVWLVFIRGDDDDESANGLSGPQPAQEEVSVVPVAQLPGAVADVGHPVYWVGERPGTSYEVTRISDGRTFIRYLPAGAEAETATPYLTVGSYSVSDATGVINRLGREEGSRTISLDDGGEVLVRDQVPDSAYLAYPGVDVQIEIYHPRDGQALEVARSGTVAPIG